MLYPARAIATVETKIIEIFAVWLQVKLAYLGTCAPNIEVRKVFNIYYLFLLLNFSFVEYRGNAPRVSNPPDWRVSFLPRTRLCADWSDWSDSNWRLPRSGRGTLPNCATTCYPVLRPPSPPRERTCRIPRLGKELECHRRGSNPQSPRS